MVSLMAGIKKPLSATVQQPSLMTTQKVESNKKSFSMSYSKDIVNVMIDKGLITTKQEIKDILKELYQHIEDTY